MNQNTNTPEPTVRTTWSGRPRTFDFRPNSRAGRKTLALWLGGGVLLPFAKHQEPSITMDTRADR